MNETSCTVFKLSLMQQSENEIPCPLTRAAQELSGKWDMVICHLLLKEGNLRFNELKTAIARAFGKQVCPSSISSALKRLEEEGIIRRNVNTDVRPVSVHYELTEKGKALEPILKALQQWGESWT